MKGVLPLFFCSALAWAGGEGLFSQSLPVRAEVGSPVAVAGFHEQLVMDGLGVLFPGEEQALIPGGIVTFGGGEDTWPPLFRLGLVARDENGVATCPFTVELDDDTGEVLFRNANGALFYSVAPAYVSAAEWFRLRLGLPAFGPVPAYRELSHIVSEWVLVQEDDVESLKVQSRRVTKSQSRSVAGLQSLRAAGLQSREIEGLAFTAFEATGSEPPGWTFSFAWNGDAVATNDVLDLYGAPALTTNEWHRLASTVASNGNECVITLSETNFPWYVTPVECPRDGCACPACIPVVVTNYAGSAFDPSATSLTMTVVTNTTCDCPSGASTGFFRLFRRADSDADGLLDADEILRYGTDPLSADSDGDFIPDHWEVAHGLNPCDAAGDNGRDGDPDADGQGNRSEWLYGLDPLQADTDQDGTPDGTTGSAWLNHGLRGSRAGFTNLVLWAEARVPDGSSAALRIDTLTMMLSPGTNLYHLALQTGRAYPFHLGCTLGAEARLRILGESELPGFSLADPDGAFSGNYHAKASGSMSLPRLYVRTLPAGMGQCVHEYPGTRTYSITATPVPWSELRPRATLLGFTENADGTLSLSVADDPPSESTGTIVIAPQLPGQPDHVESITIHRCEYDTETGACAKCGFAHDIFGVSLAIQTDATRLRVGSSDRICCSVSEGSTADKAKWTLSPTFWPDDGASLHDDPESASNEHYDEMEPVHSVWVLPGILTNDYTVSAWYDWSPNHLRTQTISAIAIDAEPICSETNEAGFVYNPCMIPKNETAQFLVKVFPEDIPDNQIIWTVTGGASFVGSHSGRIVTLRGTGTGPVHLEVSIAGYKGDKPTFDTYVEEMRPVPVVAWIVVGPNDCPATNRPHIESLIQDVNALLHQICISCYLHEVNYTSRWDWFQYDYGAIGDIADIVAVQNSSTGIEVHFVDQLIGASGISTKNGIVLPALASSCTFAHEIGHTMGFPDIYVRKRIHLVSGPVQANREPEDWSGTTNRGFYKEELSQAELICRLVMFGDYSDDSFDFPAGDIDGIRELKDYPYGYTNSMVRIGVCPGTRTWIPQND